jgi:hypothetical protein
MIRHISFLKVYSKPKFRNKGTMELVQPPLAIDLPEATFYLGFFGFNNSTSCRIENYIPPDKLMH